MKIKFFQCVLLCCVIGNFAGCQFENEKVSSQNITNVEKNPTIQNDNSELINDPKVSNGKGYLIKLPTQPNLQTKGGNAEILKSYLSGVWLGETNNDDCRLWIQFYQPTHLCIASNQIYADVRYILNAKKKRVYVYLKKTTDLSEAAMHTSWKDIDKSKPVAVIDASKAISTGLIEVEWLGFVNKKTGEIYDYGKEAHQGIHRKQRTDE